MTFLSDTHARNLFLERSRFDECTAQLSPGTATRIPITPGVTFISPDGQSFDLTFKHVTYGQSFLFTYRTTYVPGVALRNPTSMYPITGKPDWVYRNANPGGEAHYNITFVSASSRWIRIDHNTKFAGAVFEVTSTTDPSKTWTGEDGTAVPPRSSPAGTCPEIRSCWLPAQYRYV